MFKQFKIDLLNAKEAERIVMEVLQTLSGDTYTYINVSENKECWHKGDILCEDKIYYCRNYIDVKDDSCISRTGNILAEDRVYYEDDGIFIDGFMKTAKYDYVAYVSKADNKIYMLDFQLWKKNYKREGKFKEIPHSRQTTYAYLMSLNKAKELGIVVAEIDYAANDGCYYPTSISKAA